MRVAVDETVRGRAWLALNRVDAALPERLLMPPVRRLECVVFEPGRVAPPGKQIARCLMKAREHLRHGLDCGAQLHFPSWQIARCGRHEQRGAARADAVGVACEHSGNRQFEGSQRFEHLRLAAYHGDLLRG